VVGEVGAVASFAVEADPAAMSHSSAAVLVEVEDPAVVVATFVRQWLPLLPVAFAVCFVAAVRCTAAQDPAEEEGVVEADDWDGLEESHHHDEVDDGHRGSDAFVFAFFRALSRLLCCRRCAVLLAGTRLRRSRGHLG